MKLEDHLLDTLRPHLAAPAWRIALSGGLDSTVLLHLLACLRERQALPPLTAIHVQHGLQAAAEAWPAHCARQCAALGVELQVVEVKVAPGASLERAAREARYRAFAGCLGEGELLLTAQHRDDQAETLLLRLLRGAGVRGLAGMPASRPLGRGLLLRPLFRVSRAQLEAHARQNGLEWVEDPSNADPRFSRNFLRHRVLPLLREHWPGLETTLARSAEQLAEAESLLVSLAELDLAGARLSLEAPWGALPNLLLTPLLALDEARQRNALRHFLAPLTLLPDRAHWAGWQALRDAAPDAEPVWRLQGGELVRAQGRLWWLAGDWLASPDAPLDWPDASVPLKLPGNGSLRWEGEAPEGALRVGYRQGGEVLELPGRGHRDLKRLLNEARVPAFVRGRLPLVFRAERLLAVAALPGCDRAPADGARLIWQAPTSDSGLS